MSKDLTVVSRVHGVDIKEYVESFVSMSKDTKSSHVGESLGCIPGILGSMDSLSDEQRLDVYKVAVVGVSSVYVAMHRGGLGAVHLLDMVRLFPYVEKSNVEVGEGSVLLTVDRMFPLSGVGVPYGNALVVEDMVRTVRAIRKGKGLPELSVDRVDGVLCMNDYRLLLEALSKSYDIVLRRKNAG